MSVRGVADLRCDAIVREARLALLAHQAAVLEQAKVPRHAGLRNTKDSGQLGHIEPLEREESEQTQPRIVAKQPVERRRILHIYKST